MKWEVTLEDRLKEVAFTEIFEATSSQELMVLIMDKYPFDELRIIKFQLLKPNSIPDPTG